MIHEIALTIKPTMKCNMRCKHCFNGDVRYISQVVEVKSVYKFIESACKEYQDIKVTFHGGEPTLVGYDFYQNIFAYENKMAEQYGVNFSNNFTTNALLLSEELMDLLISNNVLINISFDGPYNDILRENSKIVYEKIRRVKIKGGRVRVFCTIAKGSYEHLLEIYKWFNEEEIDFKILPIEPRGYAAMDYQYLMDIEKFINVLTQTYLYWIRDKNCRIRFYTFEEFADLRRSTQFKPFWFKREIALNPNGKIYPFGRPNDIQYCLGDAATIGRLSECFDSVQYKEMLKTLSEYRKIYCENCSASDVCNGVCICMSYMYVEQKELLEYSCNQSRRIFESILEINDQIQLDFNNDKDKKYNKMIHKKFVKEL